MSRRSQLEHEVSVAQERVKKAAKDTPKDIIKLWEQELVDLELELYNLEVPGSSPGWSTFKIKELRNSQLLFSCLCVNNA